MNDNAVKNYATWARRELMEGVARRAAFYGIREGESDPADAEAVDGRVLSREERRQRRELLGLEKRDGYQQLIERAAYTWFNRLLAIRFMEVNDRLPSHVRMLSAPDGSFAPQVLSEALDLSLGSLDPKRTAELVQSGDDEALFRIVFLAQCDELADCMPGVFEHVGGAMELLLPDGLLRTGGVVEQLVATIPEEDWTEGVEIVGWMYQYYVSERKDEVFAGFKKNKKAGRDDIAPATQLFTPNWIVRYLVENSLGRLWVLNNPGSSIVERMPYFVKPDEDAETEFRRISSPEEIAVVDPACGSGHILVYAFDLLAAMYAEAGYSERDAARLIVEKNLTGLEIDPRAAAMASFAIMMKACELDSRFLRRGATPRITVLERVEFAPEELQYIPMLQKRSELLDAAGHLDECGSLLAVSAADLDAVAGDLSALAGEQSLFGESAAGKLARLQAELEPLSRRYDVVVANPPYMGSSSLGRWMGKWVKDKYPYAYRDLCTSFIERGFTMSRDDGFNAMVTMQSWMFLGSFEKLRGMILRNHSIATMAHLGTRAFGAIGGEVVSTTATVFGNAKSNAPGVYFRLVDMGSEEAKKAGLLEALANPDCGWFYRTSAERFDVVPGRPIAYWASDLTEAIFERCSPAKDFATFKHGMSTGKNDAVLRIWSEVSFSTIKFDSKSHDQLYSSGARFVPYNKGGEFRRWWGNQCYIIGYDKQFDKLMDTFGGHRHDNKATYFLECISWSKISSGSLAMRYFPEGFVYDVAGCSAFSNHENLIPLLALFNTNLCLVIMEFMSPTLNFEVGTLENFPVEKAIFKEGDIATLAKEGIELAQQDWSSFEESWDFARHPLV